MNKYIIYKKINLFFNNKFFFFKVTVWYLRTTWLYVVLLFKNRAKPIGIMSKLSRYDQIFIIRWACMRASIFSGIEYDGGCYCYL